MLKSKMALCLWWKFNIHVQCPGTEVLYNLWKRSTRQDRRFLWSDKAAMKSLVNQGKSELDWRVMLSAERCFSVPLVCRVSVEFLPPCPAGPWKERLLLQCFSCPALSAAVWDPSGPSCYDEVHNLVLHSHCRNSDAGIWGTTRGNPDFQHKSVC